MKNWFKVGIYSKQMTTIMALLGILVLGQLASCVDYAFDKAYGAEPKVLTKSYQVSNVPMEDVDEGGVGFDAPNGIQIMMPKEMRGYEKLVGYYEDSTMRIYIDDKPSSNIREDYRIRLADDFIEIWDVKQNRLVGTLTYKTSLGRMVIRDNE